MPRRCPHPLALFSLKPENERAKNVVAHPCNNHLVSILSNGALALDVGFHIRSKSCNTLAILGRDVSTDIFVEGSGIARTQCSFEIDLDTSVVMLYDRSNGGTTQVYGENATPFEHKRPRRVVVRDELNTIIGLSGEGRDLIQFELVWHQSAIQRVEKIKNQGMLSIQEENPRLARTIDEAPTILPSQRVTRPHTLGHMQLKMRYMKVAKDPLGSGQFGTVYKAVDVDSGRLIAVKILQRPTKASKQEEWRKSLYYALKREVEILSEMSHPCIVDYIASQGWDEPQVEIFMGLKEGTLESLIETGRCPSVAETVFHQMLQALDCLAWKGIIHRDVKPENILYVSRIGGQYQFQLGDFGLCNRVVDAATIVGSRLYMAPEMFREGGQTSKLDVWSLFVTILWTLNAGGFRQMSNQFQSVEDAQKAVLFAASNLDDVSRIQEMAIVNPKDRASAAQMLVKCYNGGGLTTPRSQVPALPSTTSPEIAAARTPRAQSPIIKTQTTQTKPKKQRDTNIFVAAAQFRVEKARAEPIRRLRELRQKP